MDVHNLTRGRCLVFGKIVLGWWKERLVVSEMAAGRGRTGTFFPFAKTGHKLGEVKKRISTRGCSMNARSMTEKSVDKIVLVHWRITIERC